MPASTGVPDHRPATDASLCLRLLVTHGCDEYMAEQVINPVIAKFRSPCARPVVPRTLRGLNYIGSLYDLFIGEPVMGVEKKSDKKEPLVIPELDDRSFGSVVEGHDHPIAVMFYSPTCPHCRTIEPFFREYAGYFRDSVIFARFNVTTGTWTAERLGVRGTPTFAVFCGGRPVQQVVGAVYPAILKRMIIEAIEHGAECLSSSTELKYEVTGYG